MNFIFPKDKVIHYGILKQYSKTGNLESFNLIDISSPKYNIIQLGGIDYFFTYLDSSGRNKGHNSLILKLYEAQSIDASDPIYGSPDLILKISKKAINRYLDGFQKRFLQEVDALQRCKERGYENIILIEHSGECEVYDNRKKRYKKHLYYTMEYASHDLKSYIEEYHDSLSFDQKINLCIELAKGLNELRGLNLYHRDIKPDNIFMNSLGYWKIGDLGLIGDRNSSFQFDKIAEAIGPRGWMSPESMNKHLTENKGFKYKYPCDIDHQSDIFQLGKVFWYIFQHNAPIGNVKEKDFHREAVNVYPIIKTMLNYSKNRRYKDIDEVIKLLNIEEEKYLKAV